jgi:hypothetical protein
MRGDEGIGSQLGDKEAGVEAEPDGHSREHCSAGSLHFCHVPEHDVAQLRRSFGEEVCAMHRCVGLNAWMIVSQLSPEVEPLFLVRHSRSELPTEWEPTAPGYAVTSHRDFALIGLWQGEEGSCQSIASCAKFRIDAVTDDVEETCVAARRTDQLPDVPLIVSIDNERVDVDLGIVAHGWRIRRGRHRGRAVVSPSV